MTAPEGGSNAPPSSKPKPRPIAYLWEQFLQKTRGQVKPTLANAVLVFKNRPEWSSILRYDAFAGRVRVIGALPTHNLDVAPQFLEGGEWWSDQHTDRAAVWLERHYQMALTRDVAARAIRLAAEAFTIHPVRDYLNGLKWDGKKRVDKWLHTHMRVEDNKYTREVGAKWLISAVARAFSPGEKVDHVIILEGGQRGGKSSVLRALCADEGWFLETDVELGNKDSYNVIRSKWIVELAELDSLSRGETSRVKAFVTARIDTYRPAYGREAIDQPRTCVFAGSVNPDGAGYLKDETGGGRWWPVPTDGDEENRFDVDGVIAARDQLWAEAVVRYKAGERWHLVDPETIKLAHVEQEKRRQKDPLEEAIEGLLTGSEAIKKRGVSVRELCVACEVPGGWQNKVNAMKVARILHLLGWAVSTKETRQGARVQVYRPHKVGLKK